MGSELLALRWNNHQSSFADIISSARSTGDYSDVTLACDGNNYHVHKLVLATCSEYFTQVLHNTDDKHPLIVLADLSHEVLERLLDYMYDGEVNVQHGDISELFKAAVSLKIKGLAVSQEEETSVGGKRPLENDDDDDAIADSKRQKLEEGINDILYSPSQDNRNSTPIKPFDIRETQDLLNAMQYHGNSLEPSVLLNSLQNHGNLPLFEHSHMLDMSITEDNSHDTTIHLEAEELWSKSYVSPGTGVPCPVCFKVFKRKKSFIGHVTAHNGEKPYAYSCPQCPQKFSQRSNMMTHIKNHAGEKPFSCPYCPHRTAQKGNMKSHIIHVHKTEVYIEPVETGRSNASPINNDMTVLPKEQPIVEVPKENLPDQEIESLESKENSIEEIQKHDPIPFNPDHDQHTSNNDKYDESGHLKSVNHADIIPATKDNSHPEQEKYTDKDEFKDHITVRSNKDLFVSSIKKYDNVEIHEEDIVESELKDDSIEEIQPYGQVSYMSGPSNKDKFVSSINKDDIVVNPEDMSGQEIGQSEPKDDSIEEIQQYKQHSYSTIQDNSSANNKYDEPGHFNSVPQKSYTIEAKDNGDLPGKKHTDIDEFKNNYASHKHNFESFIKHNQFAFSINRDHIASSTNQDQLASSINREQLGSSSSKDQLSSSTNKDQFVSDDTFSSMNSQEHFSVPNKENHSPMQSPTSEESPIHSNQSEANQSDEHIFPYQNQLTNMQNFYNPFLV